MSKARKITGWILASLIVLFLLIASAPAKFGLVPDYPVSMMAKIGLTGNEPLFVGILEVLAAILFIIPRTGVIGSMFLSAYMGGVIATHLEHDNNIAFGIGFQVVVWITAFIRFPELTARLFGTLPPPPSAPKQLDQSAVS